MKPFVQVTGVVAPLMRANIDTDQITPGHTGMKVESSGFGSGLFFNWRYLPDRSENPDFVLNQPPYRDSKFLVTGPNFGCGSSREFAVFALRDFGIRAVIAHGFGAIFSSNCYINGLLPISLDENIVNNIASEISENCAEMTVDLEQSVVISPKGNRHPFVVPVIQRERLLEGLDAIDATRKREPLIAAFQERDTQKRPWVYNV
jgi:3-isopropylmalate/(R)-2-methylmalate dehydratase small subunit